MSRSIPDIISGINGDWQLFRQIEFEVVQKLSSMDNASIDSGGYIVGVADDGAEVHSKRKVDIMAMWSGLKAILFPIQITA